MKKINLSKIQEILGWCIVINVILMMLTAFMLYAAHDWMYSVHQTFFKVPAETYDALLFGYMAFWKALFIVFNVIPYFALRIVDKSSEKQE